MNGRATTPITQSRTHARTYTRLLGHTPHMFQAKNHRRRIVSDTLLSEYAYLLKPNARLYTITDVEDLHQWHLAKCNAHPMFEQLSEAELKSDKAAEAMVSTFV